MARHRRVAWVIGALWCLVTAQVSAQPSDADRATARALAAEGHDALLRKDYEKAEDRFRRADLLVHAPTLVVDHARALVGLGRLADAYRRYELVLKEGVAENAPWAWKRAHKDAQREIAALEPKLSWLTVRVAGASNPEVTINDQAVAPAELGAPRAVDPGVVRVQATAPGYLPKEAEITLEPGKREEIEIELTERSPVPEEPVELETEPTPVPKITPEPPKDHTLTYIALGVGGGGLVLGIATGIVALGIRSDILARCPDLKCRPRSSSERDDLENDASRYRTFGTLSGIGFGLGLAGAGAGIALLLRSDGDAQAPQRTGVRAYVGPASAGIYGRF